MPSARLIRFSILGTQRRLLIRNITPLTLCRPAREWNIHSIAPGGLMFITNTSNAYISTADTNMHRVLRCLPQSQTTSPYLGQITVHAPMHSLLRYTPIPDG